MEKVWSWVKGHPLYAGIGVFAIGIVLYLWLRSGSSSATSTTASDPYASYYGALAASTASGNSLAATQNATAAQTTQYQLATQAATTQTQSNNQAAVQINQSNNDAAVQAANIAANSNDLIAGLVQQLGITESNNAFATTYSNNSTALAINSQNASTAYAINQANQAGALAQTQANNAAAIYMNANNNSTNFATAQAANGAAITLKALGAGG